jgi:methionine synthase I (cobalamin-dependent)
MGDVQEAKLAVAASKRTGLPVVACMVFDSGTEYDRTMTGDTIEECVHVLEAAGADVIGSNCGGDIERYAAICERLRAATTLPLWLKPNAGLPEIVAGTLTYGMRPEEFASHAGTLRQAGAQFIGGCCGTTPAFIRALVHSLLPR